MDVGNWITLGIAVIGIAATWGQTQVRLEVMQKRLSDFEETREKQGKRIGSLERWQARAQGYAEARRRRPSQVVPTKDEGEDDDESGPAS